MRAERASYSPQSIADSLAKRNCARLRTLSSAFGLQSSVSNKIARPLRFLQPIVSSLSMPLRLSFNLGDEDLRHFEEVAHQTQTAARETPPETIVAAAREVWEKGQGAHVAAFVRERFGRLQTIIAMATDAEWQPRADDRQRVLNALACFGTSSGSAGAGLLDHAIMIELVSRDLAHDIQAYQSFCKFRDQARQRRRPGVDQEQWLARKRDELQARARERRQRDLDRAGSAVRRLFSLFGI
jgi:hypothetical protein